MLTIEIDLDATVPIYQQIADGVRQLIAQGALAPGDELPSVRQLGKHIGVNQNTVARGYRQLADDELVELRQGAPARVKPDQAGRDGPLLDASSRRTLADLISRWVLRGATRREIRSALERATAEYFQ